MHRYLAMSSSRKHNDGGAGQDLGQTTRICCESHRSKSKGEEAMMMIRTMRSKWRITRKWRKTTTSGATEDHSENSNQAKKRWQRCPNKVSTVRQSFIAVGEDGVPHE